MENLVGAARQERSADRLAYRNRYRERSLKSRLGTLDLKIPNLLSGEAYVQALLAP